MRGIKRYIHILMMVVTCIALTGFGPMANPGDRSQTVYGMYVNEQEVGLVKYAGKGLAFFDQAIEEIKAEFDREVFIEGEVFFREKNYAHQVPDTDEVLYQGIRQSVDIKTDAYAITIDGRTACYVGTEAEASAVIEAIQRPYIESIDSLEDHELETVALQENISWHQERVFYAQLVDQERAVEIITIGEEGSREYTVKKGDSLWAIARAFDVRVADIQAANPELEGENIQPGQTLNVMSVQSMVTVVTKEKYVYTESIPYTTETQNDKNLYVGENKVTQQGKNGVKEIEVYITKENGKETARELISETVVQESVPQITSKGTKARPAPVVVSRSSSTVSFTRPADTSPISRSGVEMTPWGTANSVFPRGSIAKVTHLDSKLTFYVYRHGGTLHADVEPLTAADTEVMRRIYGSWSWERESIIVEVNGKKMAASMNGMPHGNYTISGNNYKGHFCIHFLNSRGHASNRIDPDHQAALKRVVQ